MYDKTIFYYSTVRGIANQDKSSRCVYLGKIFRIPRRDAGTERQITVENEVLNYIENLRDEKGFERVRPIERYEIFDDDTGDILAMVRIPYNRASQNMKEVELKNKHLRHSPLRVILAEIAITQLNTAN